MTGQTDIQLINGTFFDAILNKPPVYHKTLTILFFFALYTCIYLTYIKCVSTALWVTSILHGASNRTDYNSLHQSEMTTPTIIAAKHRVWNIVQKQNKNSDPSHHYIVEAWRSASKQLPIVISIQDIRHILNNISIRCTPLLCLSSDTK